MKPDPEPIEPAAIVLDRHLHRMRTTKDLALELDVSAAYIRAMKKAGFSMPGGKASLAMARQFLAKAKALDIN